MWHIWSGHVHGEMRNATTISICSLTLNLTAAGSHSMEFSAWKVCVDMLRIKRKECIFFFTWLLRSMVESSPNHQCFRYNQLMRLFLYFAIWTVKRLVQASLHMQSTFRELGNCIRESLGMEKVKTMLPVRPQGNVHPRIM